MLGGKVVAQRGANLHKKIVSLSIFASPHFLLVCVRVCVKAISSEGEIQIGPEKPSSV